MSHEHDPPRLFQKDEGASELGKALGAARSDGPDPEQIGSLAARLGALLDAPPPPPSPPSPPPPPPSVPWWAAPGVKLGGVLLVAAGIGGSITLSARSDPPSSIEAPAKVAPVTRSTHAAAPTAPPPLAPAPEAAEPREPPSPRAPPRAPAPSTTPRASLKKPAAPEPAAIAPTAESEIALLDRAHEAVGADPARALTLTTEHERRFPSGALAEEREVIAVTALVRLGRRGDAKARADHFRARFPGSAHLRRIDALLE